MTVSAVTSATTTPGLLSTTTDSTSTTNTVSKDSFLQLLVAQLRNQDPSNPTDSSEFLAQTAQFSALEAMQQVEETTSQLYTAQVAFGASSLLGKTVTYPSTTGTGTTTGVVQSVRFDSSGPVLVVDGTDVAVGSVQTVTNTTTL